MAQIKLLAAESHLCKGSMICNLDKNNWVSYSLHRTEMILANNQGSFTKAVMYVQLVLCYNEWEIAGDLAGIIMFNMLPHFC
jgi:hypothetical protein